MKFENTEVWGFQHAVRGMRNPMESRGRVENTEEQNEIHR